MASLGIMPSVPRLCESFGSATKGILVSVVLVMDE